MRTTLSQKEKHVVWTTIDGCHAETFYNLYFSGNLPHIRRAMGDALMVERATTCFPSVTMVCLAALATGCAFKNTGILNNVWYDRTTLPAGGRAYLSELKQTLECYDRKKYGWPTLLLPELHRGGLANNDLNPEARTIYEILTAAKLKSYSLFSYIGRGATVWRRPSRWEMLHFAEIDKRSHNYARFDRLMAAAAVNLMNKQGLPHLLSLYFGGADGNSHYNGVGTQAAYLRNVVDLQMGRVIDRIQKFCDIKDVYFVINADHGQTGFPRNGGHRPIWIDQIELMLRETGPGTVVDGGEKSEVMSTANVVYAIGNGACIYVYIRNRGTNKWADAPRLDEDVLPVAHAIMRASDPRLQNKPAYIGPFLDLIALRTDTGQPFVIYRNKFPYETKGWFETLDDYFADKKERYPDAVWLLRGIEHPTRGPDLIFMIDYDNRGYYFADCEHKGNHGSMTPEDIYIPLLMSGPDVKSGALPAARAVDIAPTIASIFDLKMPSADGEPLDIFQ